MRTARQTLWTALAISAVISLGAARAETVDVYDGLSHAQLKSILSQTNMGLSEQVTQKGVPYLIITIEGGTVPFVGVGTDCKDGQCDGFTFFFIDGKHPMSAEGMAQFNKAVFFVKARPGVADAADVVITSEFFARGGVTARHVIFSAALYAAVLESYLKQAAEAIATTGREPTWAPASAGRLRPEQLFVELTAKGGRKPPPLGAYKLTVDEALIDAAAAPR